MLGGPDRRPRRDRIVLAPDLPGLGSSEIRGPYDVRSVAASLIALLAAELDGIAGSDDGSEDDEDDAPGDTEPAPRDRRVGHDWGGSLGSGDRRGTAGPRAPARRGQRSVPQGRRRSGRGTSRCSATCRPGCSAGAGPRDGPRDVPVRVEDRPSAGGPGRGLRRRLRGGRNGCGRWPATTGRPCAGRAASPDGSSEPMARAERSLVVWGTDDPPMPLRVGESVVTDLGLVNDPATVRMVTLPGVGHWPLEEAPERRRPARSRTSCEVLTLRRTGAEGSASSNGAESRPCDNASAAVQPRQDRPPGDQPHDGEGAQTRDRSADRHRASSGCRSR